MQQYTFTPIKHLFAVFLLLFSSAAFADFEYWQDHNYQNNDDSPVSIEIIKDHGRALNQYTANNNRHRVKRAYLEANKGSHYSIRIRNRSNHRVGLVIAVDGRNILTGKKSWLGNHEKMYILDAYESSTYNGWRTSKNQVNRFYFTSSGNSYANAWGDRSAMGVIAVAVYDEKHRRQYYDKNRKRKEAQPQMDGRLGKSQRGRLAEKAGTGFGDEQYSPTVRVSFKAKNRATVKHFFKYEWRESLCKRGVINCHNYKEDREHNRFWPNQTNNGYAPYPPNHYSANNMYRKERWSDQFKRGWDTSNRGW